MSRSEQCTENLLIKAKTISEGYTKIIGRGEKGLKHLEFGRLWLTSGEWSSDSKDCEVVLDIYSGVVSLETNAANFERLGNRKNVFEGPATVIYLPPQTPYRLSVIEGPADIAVFSAAAASSEANVTIIRPEDNIVTTPGKDNWLRHVYTAIGNNLPATKIIFGETVNPPGNWSSYPPHKHDAFVPPNEVPLEEIYYFQLNPSQGFGIIRIYTEPNDPGPMDEVYVVENGDTVVIPRGYHPVAAAPGYTLHYTWAMAGDIRKPGALSDDPRHAWVKEI
ncbi:MAG: 5-deoxy-glucuronate isomerase [Armatimonadota bacterium]|nr:5-deoxy-glucuronate isomerase [Armatimonadota bacterium]